MKTKQNGLILVRGGGDIATGVIQALYRAGFPVLALETEQPTAIRRTVALSECIYEGTMLVEDLRAKKINDVGEVWPTLSEGIVPFLVDPEGASIPALAPFCVIDAIIAKRNTGTNKQLAPITIGLGPGFAAPQEVDCVIETMRGHDLGRLIFQGKALKNTGAPGDIGGFTTERVLRAPAAGPVAFTSRIGDSVEKGQILGHVGMEMVCASLSGVLRGAIRDGLTVQPGMKIGDIDPRAARTHCFTISDKARCIGGATLEAVMLLSRDQLPHA